MGSVFQFALLVVCWLAALGTLLIFLETWFGLSGRNRFLARRASGAYGVISVFVPMHGEPARVRRALKSILEQSYPFLELVLIYPKDDPQFEPIVNEFRTVRSHIPVRYVPVSVGLDSRNDRVRALELAQGSARGRWFVVLDAGVMLDRFAIETAVEFSGSNEVAALALRPGVRCRSTLQKIIAPSMEHLLHMVRIANRRREKRRSPEFDSPFLIFNREAFDIINKANRMPGILNDGVWSMWGYQVEGLRTFEADGSRWMWRDGDVRSWSSSLDPERRYGKSSAGFVIGSAIMAILSVAGVAYGIVRGVDTFAGMSILGISAISYLLMWASYFLFARRLRAAVWFAPLWILSHIPAAVLTLAEMHRISRRRASEVEAPKNIVSRN